MILGVLVPAVMLSSRKIRRSSAARLLAALLVAFGVVFNRLNVTWLAMDVPGRGTYFPSLAEIVVTISIVASLVYFFALSVKTFPVFARHEGNTRSSRRG
jgi:Ni/Fe-hydrogenase subunit HybB-like protein